MKLYQILLRHTCSKSSIETTYLRVLADNELQILEQLSHNNHIFNSASGVWKDRHEQDGLFNIKQFVNDDGDYNIIGQETYFERMLRLRGEFNDPDVDYSDAYYGIHHWGWDKGQEINQEEADTLLNFGIVEDWRHISTDNISSIISIRYNQIY